MYTIVFTDEGKLNPELRALKVIHQGFSGFMKKFIGFIVQNNILLFQP